MFLTEADAKTQTCPHIRYIYNEIDVLQEGRAPIYVQQNCQGAACKMAWRWMARTETAGRSKIEAIKHQRSLTGASLKDAKNFVEANPDLYDASDYEHKGYCGIAGRPE